MDFESIEWYYKSQKLKLRYSGLKANADMLIEWADELAKKGYYEAAKQKADKTIEVLKSHNLRYEDALKHKITG